MRDNELLELAAKATGIDYPSGIDSRFAPSWNPLTSDGDALRLAVKLNLQIHPCDDECWIGDPAADLEKPSICEQNNSDPYAATRRAIVRAAAEIGKVKG